MCLSKLWLLVGDNTGNAQITYANDEGEKQEALTHTCPTQFAYTHVVQQYVSCLDITMYHIDTV